MVQLEEVEDEELDPTQPGKEFDEDDDADFTDTDSSISSASSTSPIPSETLTDRLFALRDMISPSTRAKLNSTVSTLTGAAKGSALWSGKALWVVSTSALLLGVPWALAFAEEQQMVEMEKEARMRELGNEVLTPGATSQGQQQARPML